MVTEVCGSAKAERAAEFEDLNRAAELLQQFLLGWRRFTQDIAVLEAFHLVLGHLFNEGDGGEYHTHGNGRDQVDEDRQAQYQHHEHEIPARTLVSLLEVGPVDDV